MERAKARRASFWAELRPLGTATLTVTYWSPRPLPAQVGYALAAQTEDRPALRALGYRQLDGAVYRVHLQVRAERGLGEAHVHGAEHARAVALELVALANGGR